MDSETLSDVEVGTLVVEEAKVALAAQVVGLRVTARILQDGSERDDCMQEKLLTYLA